MVKSTRRDWKCQHFHGELPETCEQHEQINADFNLKTRVFATLTALKHGKIWKAPKEFHMSHLDVGQLLARLAVCMG